MPRHHRHHHGPPHPHHHHRRPRRHRHHGHGQDQDALRALRKLVDDGRIDSLQALIDAARDIDVDPTGKAAAILSSEDFEGLRAKTALELLAARWAAEAERSDEALRDWSTGRGIVIIPPIPPHVFEIIEHAGTITVVSVDNHHVPHFLDVADIEVIETFHKARQAIAKADLIVFDAFQDGQILARHAVVDLVGDLSALKTGIRFAVHFRPHPDHDGEDIPLPAEVIARLVEV